MDREAKKRMIIAAILLLTMFASFKLYKNRVALKDWFNDEPVTKTTPIPTPNPSNEGKTGKLLITNDPPLDEQLKKQQQAIDALKAEQEEHKKKIAALNNDFVGFAGYTEAEIEIIKERQRATEKNSKEILGEVRSTNAIVKALRRDWLQTREPEAIEARSSYKTDWNNSSNGLPIISVDKMAAWFAPDSTGSYLKVLMDIQALNAMGITLAIIPVIRSQDGQEYSLESQARTLKPSNKSYITNGFNVTIPQTALPNTTEFNLAFRFVDSNNLAKTLLMTGWKTIKQPNG